MPKSIANEKRDKQNGKEQMRLATSNKLTVETIQTNLQLHFISSTSKLYFILLIIILILPLLALHPSSRTNCVYFWQSFSLSTQLSTYKLSMTNRNINSSQMIYSFNHKSSRAHLTMSHTNTFEFFQKAAFFLERKININENPLFLSQLNSRQNIIEPFIRKGLNEIVGLVK